MKTDCFPSFSALEKLFSGNGGSRVMADILQRPVMSFVLQWNDLESLQVKEKVLIKLLNVSCFWIFQIISLNNLKRIYYLLKTTSISKLIFGHSPSRHYILVKF
jgi:hypothetical protein